ncbi:MAG: ABC transporter ATP-binding protein [Polyangiales bacterium]|nr:ABC transporter ATP-binding protein [Myxococcales bacterium]
MSRASVRPSASERNAVLEVKDLKKAYGANEVLRGVTFRAEPGKINVIVGASGAGKTVLMRQIVRLERPDSGEILLDGHDITHLGEAALEPHRRRMGMVFQMSALFDSLTVFDNVAFMLVEHTDLSQTEIREKVMRMLETLQIDGTADKMPSELSGGMKRRVAIARALVYEPALLVYDEPTTGLDPITSRTVDDLIVDTAARAGVTSIVITHDMASVYRIADRVSYLYKGTISYTGTLDELREVREPRLREFLDASGVASRG